MTSDPTKSHPGLITWRHKLCVHPSAVADDSSLNTPVPQVIKRGCQRLTGRGRPLLSSPAPNTPPTPHPTPPTTAEDRGSRLTREPTVALAAPLARLLSDWTSQRQNRVTPLLQTGRNSGKKNTKYLELNKRKVFSWHLFSCCFLEKQEKKKASQMF